MRCVHRERPGVHFKPEWGLCTLCSCWQRSRVVSSTRSRNRQQQLPTRHCTGLSSGSGTLPPGPGHCWGTPLSAALPAYLQPRGLTGWQLAPHPRQIYQRTRGPVLADSPSGRFKPVCLYPNAPRALLRVFVAQFEMPMCMPDKKGRGWQVPIAPKGFSGVAETRSTR